MSPQEITAIPIDEKYRNGDFCIVSAKQSPPIDDDLPTRFVLYGDAEPGELKLQLPYQFWGTWSQKEFRGETQHIFRHDSFSPIMPNGRAGVVKYIQQAKYVGPATAGKAWDLYGEDAVKKLRESPEEFAEAIDAGKRFDATKAREAAADLEKLKVAEDLTIQLYGLFEGRGFGKQCVRSALKLWGAKAHEILTRDPHRAMALPRVGWAKADAFYMALGKDPNALKRQALCLTYAVESDSNKHGHTWTRWEHGEGYLKAAIGGTEVVPEKALTLAVRGKILRTREDEHGRLWVADARRADAEEYCCRRLVEVMTG